MHYPTAKIDALKALYDFYDRFVQGFSFACGPRCSTCCSVNVVITSLEADYLGRHAALSDRDVQRQIQVALHRPHFIPTITTNRLAHCCLRRQEPPEEQGTHAPGQCPLLGRDKLCLVYENRPFSCRAMSSEQKCLEDGEAVMPPFLYTINLVFYQLLEHLDSKGTSGNMLDMLTGDDGTRITNTPFPGFLITETERAPLRRLLKKMKKYPVNRGLLADFFPSRIFTAQ